MFLLAVKNLIIAKSSIDYHMVNSPRNSTCEGQEHQEHEPECRDVSNPSGEATQDVGVEVPGSAHQEVCESRKKKEAEKEKQILLCKKNVKRNFVWRRCYKRNVKKLFTGRQCRPG